MGTTATLFLSPSELQGCHCWPLCRQVYKGQPWTSVKTPSWSQVNLIQRHPGVSVLHLPVCLALRRCLTSTQPASIQLGLTAQALLQPKASVLLQMSCPSKQNSCTPVAVLSTKALAQIHCKPTHQWIREATVMSHFIPTPYCHISDIYMLFKKLASGYLIGFRSHFRLCLDSLYTNSRLLWPLSEMCMSHSTVFPPTDPRNTSQSKWGSSQIEMKYCVRLQNTFIEEVGRRQQIPSRYFSKMSCYTPDKCTTALRYGHKATFSDKRKILYSKVKTHQQIFCCFLYLKALRKE